MTKVSITDVAQHAGVSIATVSRVMSQSNYPVNKQTREKVLAAASRLNYSPSPLARSLKTQRSKLIAAIVGDNTNPYFAEIMRGIEEICSEHGYLTIICNTDRRIERERRYLQTLHDYHTDGILFAGSGLHEPGYPAELDALVARMQQRKTAVVTLAQHTLQVPSVRADDFGGARAMTQYLLAQGHRRIAFIAGPSSLIVANVRMQGYMVALTEAGIPIDPQLLLPGDFSIEGGELAVRTLISFPEDLRPTAIFAANDEMALGALAGLQHFGWRVPEDISLCGFGNISVARLVVPALTTVNMPLRELGQRGARKLLAMLADEQVELLEVIPTTIIERNSTKPILT